MQWQAIDVFGGQQHRQHAGAGHALFDQLRWFVSGDRRGFTATAGVVQYLRPMDGDIADMFHPEMIWVDVTACRAATSGWLDRRRSRSRLELRRADPARADGCRA